MRVTVVAAAVCLSVVGLSAAQGVNAAIRRPVHIPAQALGPALEALAKERDFQLVYRSEVIRNLRTSGVAGELTIDEALTRLLTGTGLTYRYLGDKAVTIVPVGSTAPPESKPGASTRSEKTPEGSGTADSGADESRKDFWNKFLVAQVDQGQTGNVQVATRDQKSREQKAEPLQEVIVTAQKRQERLIDVPQSVTVLSESDLTRLGATQFSDFANTVPGLSYQTAGAGFTSVTLRGITTGYDISPTVGLYVDDVPYGASTTFVQAAQTAVDVGLFDLTRIEVLRGPQGTLYGASTMGGLLKYVTNPPDPSSMSGNVRVGVSDTASGGVNYYGAATINMPVSPNRAAVRLSGFESHDGGYIDNVGLDVKEANEGDIYGGRLDYLFKPTDPLSIRLTAFAQNVSRDGETTADYTAAGQPYGGLGQNRVLSEPFTSRFRLFSGTVIYNFVGAPLTSVTSYQTEYEHNIYDISAIYVPIFHSIGLPYSKIGLPSSQNTDKFTQEIRLASRSTGPVDWLLGGFYTHEDSYIAQYFLDQTGSVIPLITTLPQPSIYEEYAGFGDLTCHLTKQFDVTGGLRVAHNQQTFSEPPQPGSVRSSATVTTYLANARYQLNDHSTAYVRYATGYRPGGPNYRLADPVTGQLVGPAAFDADKLQSYEGGFKAETAGHRYGFDIAVYYVDWTNIQVLAIQNGIAFRTNAPPGAAVKGSELTLTARPVDDLLLTGAFAYQDAYLKAAVPALGATEGERLPAVPRFTAAVNADWVIVHNDFQPSVGATYRYVDHRLASLSPPAGFTELYTLPSYSSIDVRLAATFGSVNAQLYVHNLTDQRGQLSDLYPQFGARIALLQPRTIGALVTMKF